MTYTNPFTERSRITDAARFAGRWSELSMIFERLEAGRSVLICGPPGIGKSSLLTHVIQSAAINLELPELRAYYLDLQFAENAAEIYRTVAEALGQRSDTLAGLELALVAADAPVVLALDNLQRPIAAEWGIELLEALARVARGSDLFLVAAMEGTPPLLSEPFAIIRLGALAQTEVRLLLDAYLDGGEVKFTPPELRQLVELSGAHPAYVQRAAYHLFQSKLDPSIDWRAAYLAEARARPVPGAPLPPAIFEGEQRHQVAESSYGESSDVGASAAPQALPLPEAGPVLILMLPLAGGLVAYLISGSILVALGAALLSVLAAGLWLRPTR